MLTQLTAQDQLAALMADAMPEQILSFKFSAPVQKRIEQLVQQKQIDALTTEEQNELEKYLTYDLLIGLAKVRAVQRLTA